MNDGVNDEEPISQKVGPLTQSQLYLSQSQILAYKHMVRNIPVPTNLNWSGLHSNAWQIEKEKLTTKAGKHHFYLVTFYRDRIEKEQELKSMITGNIKAPFKDDPKENSEHVKALIEKRKKEINELL